MIKSIFIDYYGESLSAFTHTVEEGRAPLPWAFLSEFDGSTSYQKDSFMLCAE